MYGLLFLAKELQVYFPETSSGFDQIMALKGEVYRALEGRRTQRIVLGSHCYFIKQHQGVGWKEIIKNLLQLRLPIVSAKNEYAAIKRLQTLNIPVPEVVGYGCRGINPASRQSFIITRELTQQISLEELAKEWEQDSPKFIDKIKLIKEIARIARTLHQNGMNHRDFYICHFLLDISQQKNIFPLLTLIDLHRAGLRKKVPERWIVKDLAGLYFSSKNIKLSQKDLLRFMKEYRNKSVSEILMEKVFWKKVKTRGDKLYNKHG